jgi:tryptophan synthase alpha chain
MLNRIDALFQRKRKNILSVFTTAGFPGPGLTTAIIEELEKSGADLVEIGIPFSDPIADGPVIQRSSQIALEKGASLKTIFEELKGLRPKNALPVLLMGYLNSVMQFGLEKFYKACHETGIDGLILPDLSVEEYLVKHKSFADEYNIHMVFLITPATSPERIRYIDDHCRGFLYMVSSNSTTGTNKGVSDQLDKKTEELQALKLKNPVLIGFGIKDAAGFSKACRIAQGAIVGSAFISMLERSGDHKKDISLFIQSITNPSKQLYA